MSDNSQWQIVFSIENRDNHQEWVERGFKGKGQINVENTDLSDTGRVWGINRGFIGERFDRIRLVRCNLEHSRFSGGCSFTEGEIIECVWNRLEFYGGDFDKAKLENCDFANVELTRTHFIKARITGGNWSNSHLELPTFTKAIVKNVNFHKSRFPKARMYSARFINCDFRDADFTYAEPTDAYFENCDFRGTNFKNCQLKNTTFKQCGFHGCYDTPEFLGEVKIIAPDLSEAFDGSNIVEPEQIISLWQNNLPAPPPPPPPPEPLLPLPQLEDLVRWLPETEKIDHQNLEHRAIAFEAIEILIDRFIHEAIDLMEGVPEQDEPFFDWEYVFDEFEEGDSWGYSQAVIYWFEVEDGKPSDRQIQAKLNTYGVNIETPERRDMFYRYFVAHKASEAINSILRALFFRRPLSQEVAETEIKRLEQIMENSVLGETRLKWYFELAIEEMKEWLPILKNNIPGKDKDELTIQNFLRERKELLSATEESTNPEEPGSETTQEDSDEQKSTQLQAELQEHKEQLKNLQTQLKKVEAEIENSRRTNIWGRPESGKSEAERDRLVQEIADIQEKIRQNESLIQDLSE